MAPMFLALSPAHKIRPSPATPTLLIARVQETLQWSVLGIALPVGLLHADPISFPFNHEALRRDATKSCFSLDDS